MGLVFHHRLKISFLGKASLFEGAFGQLFRNLGGIPVDRSKNNQELVPSLKASIQNPANLCEGIAADGWIRGGLPSRELSRDQDYFSKCN